MSTAEIQSEPAAEGDQEVTPLELFFDLVLVFAITQVTGFVSVDPSWLRLVEGLAILAALWWAWVSFAWLANSANSDEGAARVVLLSAMGALMIVSLAVPQAFGGSALAFGLAYLCVRLLHLGAYLVVSREDRTLSCVASSCALPRRSSRRPFCSCSRASSVARRGVSAGVLRWRSTTGGWRCEASMAGRSSPATSPSVTA